MSQMPQEEVPLDFQEVLNELQSEIGATRGQAAIDRVIHKAVLKKRDQEMASLAGEIQRLQQVLRDNKLEKFIDPPKPEGPPAPPGAPEPKESVHPDQPSGSEGNGEVKSQEVDTATAEKVEGESKHD
jgi:hypothetical protein